MKSLSCCIVLFLFPLMVISSAFLPAQADEKIPENRLLIFTGSDWCPNCRRLEKKILDDSLFIAYARSRITLELADFPQHKKLEKPVIEKNRALAEKYSFQGVFPTILLLDSAGNIRAEIHYRNQNTVDFIDQLNRILRQKNN